MWKKIIAKHDSTCRRCYKRIKKDQEIEWHTDKHTARHVECDKRIRLTYGRRRVIRKV